MFLPTKCMALLEALCAARPAHCLLAADFDALPDTTIRGKNAPLVATTVRAACYALAAPHAISGYSCAVRTWTDKQHRRQVVCLGQEP